MIRFGRHRSDPIVTVSVAPHETRSPARDYRKELWIAVCAGVASANDCKDSTIATTWASNALREFDRKFPEALAELVHYEKCNKCGASGAYVKLAATGSGPWYCVPRCEA